MSIAKADPLSEQGPKPEDILQQMERVLASGEFHSPERGRKFFRFVVTETLEGRSQFLKAFTIANEIFGRQSSFDAQNDPVVRIEAGRIRRGLERYYLVAGQSDAIVITIPKGGYVPHFEYAAGYRAADQSEHGPERIDLLPSGDGRLGRKLSRTTLAIGATVLIAVAGLYFTVAPNVFTLHDNRADLPASDLSRPIVIVDMFQSDDPGGSASDIAQGLRDEVIGQLATFGDIVVVADPSKANDGSSKAYSLQGGVNVMATGCARSCAWFAVPTQPWSGRITTMPTFASGALCKSRRTSARRSQSPSHSRMAPSSCRTQTRQPGRQRQKTQARMIARRHITAIAEQWICEVTPQPAIACSARRSVPPQTPRHGRFFP
jgi:hypothetical protein